MTVPVHSNTDVHKLCKFTSSICCFHFVIRLSTFHVFNTEYFLFITLEKWRQNLHTDFQRVCFHTRTTRFVYLKYMPSIFTKVTALFTLSLKWHTWRYFGFFRVTLKACKLRIIRMTARAIQNDYFEIRVSKNSIWNWLSWWVIIKVTPKTKIWIKFFLHVQL